MLALSMVRDLPLAVVCCVLVGYGLILFMSTSQAVVQLSASDQNRGPIMGIWSMAISGAQPLGNLLIGPSADRLGEPVVLRLQAVGCAVGALVVLGLLLWFSRLRAGEAEVVCKDRSPPVS
jgi:MFS family permease